MSWEVIWDLAALNEAAGFVKTHNKDVSTLLDARDVLEQTERPEGSRSWGAHHRRLHLGPWRVLYRIDRVAHQIHIEHVGYRSD